MSDLVIPVEIFNLVVSIATAIMSAGLVKSVKLYSHRQMAIFIFLSTLLSGLILFTSLLFVLIDSGAREPNFMPFARAVSQALTIASVAIATSILRQGQIIEINPLVNKAHFDALTQLYRKDSFNMLAEKRLEEAIRSNGQLSIIIFDIDHFKEYNDSWGHLAGDYALKMVAQAVANSLRDDDILARWGGEEFSVLVNEPPDTAWIISERIHNTIQTKCTNESDPLFKRCVTVSVGATSLLASDGCIADLFLRADQALYFSKNNGRNQFTVYQVSLAAAGG